MIYGRTHEQQANEYKTWRLRYSYYPVTLEDGRWIWLERYWELKSNDWRLSIDQYNTRFNEGGL